VRATHRQRVCSAKSRGAYFPRIASRIFTATSQAVKPRLKEIVIFYAPGAHERALLAEKSTITWYERAEARNIDFRAAPF
jgi:hypothetical protein